MGVCMFTKLDAQVSHMECGKLEVQCSLVNFPFMVNMNKVILKLQPLLQKKRVFLHSNWPDYEQSDTICAVRFVSPHHQPMVSELL